MLTIIEFLMKVPPAVWYCYVFIIRQEGQQDKKKGGGDGGNRTNIADRGCDDSECITAICPDSNAAGQTTNRNGDKNVLNMDLSYIRKTPAGLFGKECGAGNQENTKSGGGNLMSKEERKEMIERLAEKFASLPDSEKSFIAGYMARAEEENARREQRKPELVAQCF